MNKKPDPRINQNGKRRLLSVLAHPDDESFGMGGTLAHYAKEGVFVQLICATRGEAGEVDEEYLQGYESIAERREAELRCAAQKLGLSGVTFLDYRDSGMPGSTANKHPQALVNAPLDEVAAKIASCIRDLRPQVVLTFDPIGGYKHPDHIATHKATVRAFELAGDASFQDGRQPYRPAKLYYHVLPKRWLKLAVRIFPLFGQDPQHLGRNKDINLLPLIEEGDFPTHARINYRDVADLKDAASMCHISQMDGGSLSRGPMRWSRMLIGSNDHFMRAVPPPQSGERERDLFQGL